MSQSFNSTTTSYRLFSLLNLQRLFQMPPLLVGIAAEPVGHAQVVQRRAHHGMAVAVAAPQLLERLRAQAHGRGALVVVLAGGASEVQPHMLRVGVDKEIN